MGGGPFPRDFPRRGEIYQVDFNPSRGSEQAGVRPAVVVSSDIPNQHSSVVVVAAITSKRPTDRARLPSNVFLPAGELPKDSAILCNQLLTVAKDRLIRYRGELDATRVTNLNRALSTVLALPRP